MKKIVIPDLFADTDADHKAIKPMRARVSSQKKILRDIKRGKAPLPIIGSLSYTPRSTKWRAPPVFPEWYEEAVKARFKQAGIAVPKQPGLRIPTRLAPRKNRFTPRPSVTRNEPQHNDMVWTEVDIMLAHNTLLDDFLEHFEDERFAKLPISDQYDYWAWIEREEGEFTLRDCLVLSGYRKPDAFIDGIRAHRPDWMDVLDAIPLEERYAVVSKIPRSANRPSAAAQAA